MKSLVLCLLALIAAHVVIHHKPRKSVLGSPGSRGVDINWFTAHPNGGGL